MDDNDYYRQRGAPPCDDDVEPAEPNSYANYVGPNEEETPLKCYRLDQDQDIVGDKVYVNGEGKPVPPSSRMMAVQNAIDTLNPENLDPGIKPGDLEVIFSYILAAVVGLTLLATIIYYGFRVYRNNESSFMTFVKGWALKWPFC